MKLTLDDAARRLRSAMKERRAAEAMIAEELKLAAGRQEGLERAITAELNARQLFDRVLGSFLEGDE